MQSTCANRQQIQTELGRCGEAPGWGVDRERDVDDGEREVLILGWRFLVFRSGNRAVFNLITA